MIEFDFLPHHLPPSGTLCCRRVSDLSVPVRACFAPPQGENQRTQDDEFAKVHEAGVIKTVKAASYIGEAVQSQARGWSVCLSASRDPPLHL